MRKYSFIFILLYLFTAPLFAEVYKCNDEGVVRFSKIPCEQLISLESEDDLTPDELNAKEEFITPVYSGWKHGWQKTKDLKLERFFEVVYKPVYPDSSNQSTRINQQMLTNLPPSMTIERFAISVEDIIQSVCANAFIFQPNIDQALPNRIFYGQYGCSFRRDTKKGELGYYKIMRGENSIYMIAIKWSVEPFEINSDNPMLSFAGKVKTKQLSNAEQYLQHDVKLCRGSKCI